MARKTKKLEAAQRAFQKRVKEHLLELGAVEESDFDRSYAFTLQTPAGVLRIHVYEDWIAQRFDDVQAGSLFTRKCCYLTCNRYSGKWNYHYFCNQVLDKDCESDWKDDLGRLMSIPMPLSFAERLETYLGAMKTG